MIRSNLLFIFIITLSLWSCGGQSTQEKTSESTVPSVVQRVDAATFKQKIDKLDTFHLVDVRTPAEFKQKTIPNAINIDVRDAQFMANSMKLSGNRPLLVFCASGNRSKSATATMEALGFKNITELDGGIKAWIEAGYTITSNE